MSQNLMSMLKKMKALAKQAVVSAASDDSSDIAKTQVTYNGKTAEAVRLSPYGLCANAPLGSLGVVLSPNGSSAIKYFIGDSMYTRLKGLKPWEVAIYNHKSKSMIYLKENGDIEVESTKDVKVNTTGNIEAVAGGNMTAQAAGSMTLTAPSILLNGNTTINGTLASGAITAPAATINSLPFGSHTHPINSGSSAPGPTGGPQ